MRHDKHLHSQQKSRKSFFRVLVSLAFVVLVGYCLRGKWVEAFGILKNLDLRIFTFVCFLFGGIVFITTFRLKHVLQIQSLKIAYSKLLYLNFVGLFFNLFLPSSLGGDVVKAFYVSRESGSKLKTISSIIVDRLFGLTAVIFVAFVSLLFCAQLGIDSHLMMTILTFSVSFLFIVVIVLNQNLAKKFSFIKYLIPTQALKQKLTDFYHTVSYFRHHPRKLIFCFILSLIVQSLAIWMGFLVSDSLRLGVSFQIFLLILPVTAIVAMLPSLGGLGVREASVVYFLSRYTSVEGATAFAVAYDILIYGFGLICGIVFALLNGKMTAEKMGIDD